MNQVGKFLYIVSALVIVAMAKQTKREEEPQKSSTTNNKNQRLEEEAEEGNMGAQEAVEIRQKVKKGGGRDLTTAEAGKLGGETVSAEKGEEFYEEIGTKGQQALKQKLGSKEAEFREKTGRAGGLSRTGSFNEYGDQLEQINADVRRQAREDGKIPEEYDDYLSETIRPAMKAVRGNYKTWVGEMYRLLTEVGGCTPLEARNIVELDGQEMGISYLHIVRHLPAEAKNQVKAAAARQKGQAIRNAQKSAKAVDDEEEEEAEDTDDDDNDDEDEGGDEEVKKPNAGEVPVPQRGAELPSSLLIKLDEQIIDAEGNESTWVEAHDMAVNRANRYGTGKIRFIFDEEELENGVLSVISIEPVQAKPKAKQQATAA